MTEYYSEEQMIELLRDAIRTHQHRTEVVYLTDEYSGYVLQYGNIYTSPGRYPLFIGGESSMLGLDFLFDIPDSILIRLREVLVRALEQTDVPFIPISHNAFGRLHMHSSTVELVHRSGMQCVFSGIPIYLTGDNVRRYFISGFDSNESPPLYFCARLPHEVETYDEAIEALKPSSVKLAEKKGLEVLRQGDMFAIPTKFSTKDLVVKMSAHVTNDSPGLYGTGHVAERTACLPDGTQFASRFLYHRPRGRRPDHHDLPLDHAKWYLIVKNTVPVVPVR